MGNDFHSFDDKIITNPKRVTQNFRLKESAACSVSFWEIENNSLGIRPEIENAATRLAESCIRSYLCQTDINEIDRDGDLYFESIQSNLNELVDFYAPKIMPKELNARNYYPELNQQLINNYGVKAYLLDVVVKGLPTLQRLRDVVISNDGYQFDLSGIFRVGNPEVELELKFSEANDSSPIRSKTIAKYITISATFQFDLSSDSCKVGLRHLDSMYPPGLSTILNKSFVVHDSSEEEGFLDKINIAKQAANYVYNKVTGALEKFGPTFITKLALSKVSDIAVGQTFDCEDYMNEFFDKVPTVDILNGSE